MIRCWCRVAGDSADGNLAAVLALLSREGLAPPLAAQILIYPNTDAHQSADSYRRFADGFGLTAATMAWFRDHYVRTPDDITDWRVSPLWASSLVGAAPAFVAIAGYDILADEGTAYAVRLRADDVPLVLWHWPGQDPRLRLDGPPHPGRAASGGRSGGLAANADACSGRLTHHQRRAEFDVARQPLAGWVGLVQ